MAPIRRYLRITKYSVLECRIYLDSPALAQSWLLNPRDPILPKVIEAIRPLVIPKLREEKERERGKKKSAKKKTIKDVIVKDDFEVSVFLMETDTRHSLLSKHKLFREKGPSAMQSNASKLIAETNANPIDVEASDFAPIRIEEDSDNEGVALSDIPSANTRRQAKRQRSNTIDDADDDDEFENAGEDSDSVTDEGPAGLQPMPKRQRGLANPPAEAEGGFHDEDDYKKKLAMDVSYEGFAIYGRVLCLVVKKRENKPQQALGGQAKMENWITSTQIPVGEEAS
ncbi:hypothetical protein HDV57DRAFT_514262 [Trichoderma longibrachiatum]|uniref:Uncharacterized protein n=1 Tax=Trichoderma longibrachiatum ATCC 18648 TaxID=983965 RepID=A0A2T4BW02_TRILO|nr:hypothetical protein M440DRAFT_7198 [Trichoderma longibrachiatum ATCC 18648]